MRRLLPLACLLALLFPAAAGAQTTTGPQVTTVAASPVGVESATLRGRVNPNGAATVYRFEIGTTTDYGIATGDRQLLAGTTAVDVEESLSFLSEDTTYHFRLIAWPASDPTKVVRGTDRTFRTLALPGVTTGGVRDTRGDGVTLVGRVDPNRTPTTWYFEWGPTRDYGNHTPEMDGGRGATSLEVTAPVDGLPPNTAYNYRLVATNAAGVRRGANRVFRTLRQPTAISVGTPLLSLDFGDTTTVVGKVEGTGVGGIRVGLEAQPFPFLGPWQPAGNSVSTGSDGSFRLVSPPVWITTRLQVVAKSAVSAVSPPITAFARLLVDARALALDARRTRIQGVITPRVTGARVELLKRARGKWRTVRRVKAGSLGGGRFGYRITVKRARKTTKYRARVVPRDQAYLRATSKTVSVPRLARRR
jgi:hypothetical protein